jgi:hypothetical protein
MFIVRGSPPHILGCEAIKVFVCYGQLIGYLRQFFAVPLGYLLAFHDARFTHTFDDSQLLERCPK